MKNNINKELPDGIRYISKTDIEFPEKILELRDCPEGIYVRGSLPDPKKKSVAIVGPECAVPMDGQPPLILQGYWQQMIYRLSADWRSELTAQPMKGR